MLIEQQESQIVELESELQSAQSKLQEKETELQALKDCVKRLTQLSLSTVSGRTSPPFKTFLIFLALILYSTWFQN